MEVDLGHPVREGVQEPEELRLVHPAIVGHAEQMVVAGQSSPDQTEPHQPRPGREEERGQDPAGKSLRV
jgi:hypothetical protein